MVILIFFTSACCCGHLFAQKDSTVESLKDIPAKYISSIDKKVNQYTNRITSKTTKTLEKLSRWETRIQATLQKVNPDAANRLFGNGQLSFGSLLQKIKQGEAVALQYHQQYDKYRDDLTTNIKYLEKQKAYLDEKVVKQIKDAQQQLHQLNEFSDSTDAIQQFIKERKKQLINEAINVLGKNKYLSKMNKEVYYYSESLRNYKEIFNDTKKAEALASEIISRIPAFKDFFKQNSLLSSLFGAGSSPNMEGLQTRTEVGAVIQDQINAGGPNAQNILSQNIQAAKEQLNNFKSKIANLGTSGADLDERLGTFKPNSQKAKTILQRIQFGVDFQSQQSSNFFPATTDVGFKAGYALNDKASIGIGTSVKIGWGKGFDNIAITTQGISLRSFAEYKIKGTMYAGGGFEYNYQQPTNGLMSNIKIQNWQKSGLAGISKVISTKTKFYKKTKVQLFWDFLSFYQLPKTSPVKFRIGYVF